MFPFLETIKLKDGVLQNLDLHNERIVRTLANEEGEVAHMILNELIEIPEDASTGVYKCRFLYNQSTFFYEFQPYKLRKVSSLQLVANNVIDYAQKLADRSCFDGLKTQSEADDVLIVKNGCIADTSYANIIFFDGERWLTPDTPLLQGIKRQKYLNDGLISEIRIRPEDIAAFKKARIINAMIDFDESPDIAIENIRW